MFAFSIILWEIAEVKQSYQKISRVKLIKMIGDGFRLNLPKNPLADLVEVCWHQDPNQRPNFVEIFSRVEDLYFGYDEDWTAKPKGDQKRAFEPVGILKSSSELSIQPMMNKTKLANIDFTNSTDDSKTISKKKLFQTRSWSRKKIYLCLGLGFSVLSIAVAVLIYSIISMQNKASHESENHP